jgi:hypothetical protein
VRRPDVQAVDVAERAVPRLADHRQRPPAAAETTAGDAVGHDRITHDPNAVRGDRDRAAQLAGLADPLEPGQLTVAVEPVAAATQAGRRRRRGVR